MVNEMEGGCADAIADYSAGVVVRGRRRLLRVLQMGEGGGLGAVGTVLLIVLDRVPSQRAALTSLASN